VAKPGVCIYLTRFLLLVHSPLLATQKQEPDYNFVLPHRDPLHCPVGALAILLYFMFDQGRLMAKFPEWDWSRSATWRKVSVVAWPEIRADRGSFSGEAAIWPGNWQALQWRCAPEDVWEVFRAHHNQVTEETPPRTPNYAHGDGGNGVRAPFGSYTIVPPTELLCYASKGEHRRSGRHWALGGKYPPRSLLGKDPKGGKSPLRTDPSILLI
jgi:hypothetical protein